MPLLPEAPPRPQTSQVEHSGARPELGQVWSLVRMWPLCPDLGVSCVSCGRVETGTSGNLNLGSPGPHLSLDADALGWWERGREAVAGSDRMCPARDSLLGRSKDAAEEEGSGSLSVLTLGNHISCPPPS